MKLTQIDLTNLVAIGHNNNKLGLLIDQEGDLEYVEIPAPQAAFDGLQQLDAVIASESSAAEIDMQPIRSSMANAVGYDGDRNVLRVEFSGGATYQFENVDRGTWQALQATHSPGRFFNHAIKGHHPSKRIC
jgi:hypothetical protein